MRARIGIDIGGTFTDVVLASADGTVSIVKLASTPDDYARAIGDGVGVILARRKIAGGAIDEVIHGTTIATNAIVEKTGARTGLITTEGFRDVLEIRRLRMPVLYDLGWRKPPPLVDRARRFEVAERIDHRGRVQRPLDPSQAAEVVAAVLSAGLEAIAICLFNAYASGAHERLLLQLIRERDPDIPVCLSSELLPEIKEYERTSTTVVNAYILPVVARYLRALEAVLRKAGIGAPLKIMQSNGGTMGVEAAAARPIHIIESGPAAGAVGAAELGRKLGLLDLLSFDMGGTTAKAAMIEGGRIDRLGSLDVGAEINLAGRLLSGGGYHVRVPAIDIAEVGAGGGSLVGLDAGGALRVGPASAGAVPGPVCYGQGGVTPTVTDANVVLGFLNPEFLVGGGLGLDRRAAADTIEAEIARPLGLSLEAAAHGIHTVANATMARALRAVSSARGRDPRGLALMAFGGNGPVHAATLARSLDIAKVLVPPVAGVFSALGLLFPETEHHYVRTFKQTLEGLDADAMAAVFEAMEGDGRAALEAEGYPAERRRLERLADMRYHGENSELTVPLAAADGSDGSLDRLRERFAEAHDRAYGYRSDDEAVELVNLRVVATGQAEAPRVPDRLRLVNGAESAAETAPRRVFFGAEIGWLDTPILRREAITGDERTGPLIIEEYDSTTVVPPGCRVRSQAWDVLVIDIAGREG